MYNTYEKQSIQILQVSSRNWLSAINNKTLVTQISIPGTHDSAAYQTPHIGHKIFTSVVWKTQDQDIQTQLFMGIRFFDIRVKCEQGQKISLYHGPVYLGQFQIVMKPIVQFLKVYRTQFVILLFQKQQGKQNSISSGKKIIQEIKQFIRDDISIFDYDSKYVPTVGQLRGKLWLVEAFPGNHNRVDLVGQIQISTYCSTKILSDGRTYIIQNYWEGPQDKKKQAAMEVINCPHRQMLRVNFIIQSNLPRFYANRYNKWLKKMMKGNNLKRVGVVIMDFPDEELIDLIIKSNF